MRGRLTTGDEWWRPMPSGASADALRVLAACGVRAFGDGFVGLLLPISRVDRGFSALAVCRLHADKAVTASSLFEFRRARVRYRRVPCPKASRAASDRPVYLLACPSRRGAESQDAKLPPKRGAEADRARGRARELLLTLQLRGFRWMGAACSGTLGRDRRIKYHGRSAQRNSASPETSDRG